MAQKLIRFTSGAGAATEWGFLQGDQVAPLAENFSHLSEVLAAKPTRTRTSLPLVQVKLLSPVTAPCNLFCQGKNYLDHIVETGAKPRHHGFPLFFMKAASSITTAQGEVIRPKGVELLDYELELGLVMGRAISAETKITPENFFEYVAGLTITNDISARDIQIPEVQWFRGKSFRTFCPIGPFIYLFDGSEKYEQVVNLNLRLSVNGKIRQQGNTNAMMFPPAEALTHLSKFAAPAPGDVVLTGTPAGVALQVKTSKWQEVLNNFRSPADKKRRFVEAQKSNARYLQPGDEIRATIRGSGSGPIDLGEQILRILDCDRGALNN